MTESLSIFQTIYIASVIIISTFFFFFKKFNLSTLLKLELNSVVNISNPLKEFSKTQNVHAPQSKRAIRTGPALENDKVYKN
jgi:hypothetical protein